VGVAGVAFRLERRCFLGDGVFTFGLVVPMRGFPVWRRLLLFCIVATRSAASDIDTGEAGLFLVNGIVADVGGLVKRFDSSCSSPRDTFLITPLFLMRLYTS
jgi:hypothetical protein